MPNEEAKKSPVEAIEQAEVSQEDASQGAVFNLRRPLAASQPYAAGFAISRMVKSAAHDEI